MTFSCTNSLPSNLHTATQVGEKNLVDCVLQPSGQGRRQEAEGTYVNVMDYTENGKHSCPALPITGQSPRIYSSQKICGGVRDAQ